MLQKIYQYFLRHAVESSIILIVFGVIIILLFSTLKPFNDWSFHLDSELFARFGDFIGGFIGTVFSLVGLFLLVATLRQQGNFARDQSFESSFFQLINIQRLLADEIKTSFASLSDANAQIVMRELNGRLFFSRTKSEMNLMWQGLNNENYRTFDPTNDKEWLDKELYHFDYLYENHDQDCDKKKRKFIDELRPDFALSYYQISNIEWSEFQNFDMNHKLKRLYAHFFRKYHFIVSHYCRHAYHILKLAKVYEDQVKKISNGLSETEAKAHVKGYTDMFQAQLSPPELLLLFYNAFAFEKSRVLFAHYGFLENLDINDLISEDHNCLKEVSLKNRMSLFDNNLN